MLSLERWKDVYLWMDGGCMRRARCRSKRVRVCTRVCPCDPNWCTKTEQVCIGTKKMSSGLHSLVRYHSMIIEFLSELCSSVKVGS